MGKVIITNNSKFGARFPWRVVLVLENGTRVLLAKCADHAMACAARDAFERNLGEGE
jgi:hypothetical protein